MCLELDDIYKNFGPQLMAYVGKYMPDDKYAQRVITEWSFLRFEENRTKIKMTKRAIGIYLRLVARDLITNYFHSIYGKEESTRH